MGVDRYRVCELYAEGQDGEGSGSGYRLSDRLVLTAQHVIAPALVGRGGRVLVRPVDVTGWLRARVEWQDADADAALVAVEDEDWRAPAGESVLRWGELVGSDPVPYAAVGFPWASVRRDQVRDTAHIYGHITPLGQLRQGRLDLDVNASPSARSGGSPWAGMSGAGVIADDHLVGVITVDPGRYQDRLVAVPTSRLLTDQGFRAQLAGQGVPTEAAPAGVGGVLPPVPTVPTWVVDRPDEVAEVVAALLGDEVGTVGLTTGLHGAGGFGKTTLAEMVRADSRVRQQFRGGVYWVTVGRDVRDAGLAARVNDLIKLVAGEDVAFSDPEAAGQMLGSLLDTGPLRLLILDDVREQEQLAPFTDGGRRCARLVTTRIPGLLDGRGMAVRVDQMSPEQARRVLTSGLPGLGPELADTLLAVTGRWPLLLRLVNKILANAARAGQDLSAAGTQLLDRLYAGGPAVVDKLSGTARDLDVGKPTERTKAVRATIEASTSLLDRQYAERFAELGIFAEDEAIPFGLAALLWRATAGLEELEAAQVWARLGELALVSPAGTEPSGVVLHDVIREFLRGDVGPQRLTALNSTLLDAVAADLPAAAPLGTIVSGAARVAWWELDGGERYLWEHLIEHLLDAGRHPGAEEIASDLRWVGAQVQHSGPAVAAADLSLVNTPRTRRLGAVLAPTAHLLVPTQPVRAVIDVLHSRVAGDPDWGAQVTALRDLCRPPRLVNRWPLPDLPDSALRRILTGHGGQVAAVVAAPDGSWLASADYNGTVRIWDAATGEARATLTGHHNTVKAVVVAPDGSWLASGGDDGTVRIWDAATGEARATLTGHHSQVTAVAVAPDGSWLASSGYDGTARIWNAATWEERAALTGHSGPVSAVAVAPDGSWLASSGYDGTARIWDAATGDARATLTGYHSGSVSAVAVAPDGSWLATGGHGTARIWDAATGKERAALTGHIGSVHAIAVAPDGSWLATASDGTYHRRAGGPGVDSARGAVRIWDAATGQARAALTGHGGAVNAVAVAPDGSWLVSASQDETVRIWDAATGKERATLTGHSGTVNAVAVAPDGSWLATGGYDQTVRIWDAAAGQPRATPADPYNNWVRAVAVAPDSSWLATGGGDGTVRIWDAATGKERATLTGHRGQRATRNPQAHWPDIPELLLITGPVPVNAVAVAPDGSWLASGGDDDAVRIWDAATGKERATLTGHSGTVHAVAVAPDGSWLATAGDDAVRIWDAATGKERATLTGHSGTVHAVAVAPDGSWLATAADDAVRIWDAATGKERATLTGHSGTVHAIAVAPDGSWLASGGYDQTVRIWDAATGKERATLTGHRGTVHAIAVAPDGSWLASVGDEGTMQIGEVRIWDAATGQARALMRVDNMISACAWLGTGGLAAGGAAGLYLFDFLSDIVSTPTSVRRRAR